MKIKYNILDFKAEFSVYDKYFLIFILLLSAFFAFWKLGGEQLADWDESRQGVNAFEMIQKKDYINYYYSNDQLDTWNAKPPLMVWLITVSYKLFGYNEFALRFPSALSVLFFFIFAYKIIRLYRDPVFTTIVCTALMGCKAVFSWHIGRTGDFDAMLMALVTASAYYTLLYVDFNKRYGIVVAAFFLSLAFYTKGIPAFFLLPGIFLYALLKDKLLHLFKDPLLYVSIILFLLISGSWFLLLVLYGKTFDPSKSYGGSKNALETMIFYDTFQRFSSKDFDPANDQGRNLAYFFAAMRSRLNGWSYVFYTSCILGVYLLFVNRKNLKTFILLKSNNLILLSLCISVSLSLLLTVVRNQHDWYLSPAFLFIAIIAFTGIFYLYKKYQWISYPLMLILITSLFMQFFILNNPSSANTAFFSQHRKTL